MLNTFNSSEFATSANNLVEQSGFFRFDAPSWTLSDEPFTKSYGGTRLSRGFGLNRFTTARKRIHFRRIPAKGFRMKILLCALLFVGVFSTCALGSDQATVQEDQTPHQRVNINAENLAGAPAWLQNERDSKLIHLAGMAGYILDPHYGEPGHHGNCGYSGYIGKCPGDAAKNWVQCTPAMVSPYPHPGWIRTPKGWYRSPHYIVRPGEQCARIGR